MKDEPGGDPSPAPRFRGMIDPALHRPAAPPLTEPDQPSEPLTAHRRPGTSGDLVDDPEAGAADDTDELHVDAAPTALVRLARAVRAHPGRTLTLAIALTLVLATVITVQVVDRNRRETFSQGQVMAAMTAFRPPSSSSSIRAVGPDLGAGQSSETVTVSPQECAPLVTLRPDGVIGGAEWLDISGPTYDSTQLQLLRFANPRVAQTTLASLSDSLARCGSVDIGYTTDGDSELQTIAADTDVSEKSRFGYRADIVGSFYYDVRQFGNTIIWVYGSGANARDVRAGAATDLVGQLQHLASQ